MVTALVLVAATLAAAPPPPLGNVRIRVRSEWTAEESGRGAAVTGVSRRGVGVQGGAGSTRSQRNATQEILAMAGGRAEIRVATETPYATWLYEWSLGHGLVAQGTEWRETGTSLVVEPAVTADGRIRLRLTPRIVVSRAGAGAPLAVDVAEMATEVMLAPGQELDLGGLPMSDETFRERFFVGFTEGRRSARVSMTVSATVE